MLVSALVLAWLLGASKATSLSLAPKSVTTSVAMGISEKIGGIPSLTAVIVVLTGVVAAALGRFVFNALGVKSHAERGFASAWPATARAWLAPWLIALLR